MAKIKAVRIEKNILYVSAPIACRCVGLSPSGLSKWMDNNDFEKEPDGSINLTKLVQARKDVVAPVKNDDKARKLKAEADFKTSKARQEEMITLEMMGSLIPQEQIKTELENLFLDIRQKLLALPDLVKVKVSNIDPTLSLSCMEVVNDEVQSILKRLAESNNEERAREVGTKPKRRYTKRKKNVSTAAETDGE